MKSAARSYSSTSSTRHHMNYVTFLKGRGHAVLTATPALLAVVSALRLNLTSAAANGMFKGL